jgi:hypothetical protein
MLFNSPLAKDLQPPFRSPRAEQCPNFLDPLLFRIPLADVPVPAELSRQSKSHLFGSI